MKLSKRDFDRVVKRAVLRIPVDIRQHLGNILITVQKRPSPDLLEDMSLPPDEPLLGVFQGVALTERTVTSPPLFPGTIILFQEPLEEICETIDELEEEIEVTVVHEVAHFLGMSEEKLAELGYE
jgi:predicted Zn-dependent protease with MMP-like domain